MISNLLKHLNIALMTLLLAACGSDNKPEPDIDGDTIPDARDNCIQIANTDQLNTDGDAAGDACDALPEDATETKDFDGDGQGDNADLDDDKDGVDDLVDAFPFDKTEWADADQDEIGDNKDLDPTSANPNSIQLDQLIKNGRVTKFIGAASHTDERESLLGLMVKNIGDVNGDDLDDLYLGNHATRFYPSSAGQFGIQSGLGYILFGQSNGWPATVDLTELSNIPHVVIKSGTGDDLPHALLGEGIAALGDIDQDGIDDFMINAGAHKNVDLDLYTGGVFLVFGRSTWIEDAGDDKTITLADLANYAVTIQGSQEYDLLGSTLVNIGDLNGDGKPEVAISENLTDDISLPRYGRIHILFNIAGYTKADIAQTYDIEGIINTVATDDTEAVLNRVVLEGETNYFGELLSGMGDFNDDGFDDLIIKDGRAIESNSHVRKGRMYVMFGKSSSAWADTWNLDTMTEGEGFSLVNTDGEFDSRLGRDFKVADLNADNIPDILVSTTSDNNSPDLTNVSNIHVLWGGDKDWPAIMSGFSLPAELGLNMVSEEAEVSLGTQVEVIPDTNNNGYPELLIATDDSQLSYEGAVNPANQVYKLDASLIEQGLEIGPSLLDSGDAERISLSHIEEDDPFYMNVIGDFNGDGLSEMTFSATRKDSNGLNNNGEFYLLYGYDQLYPQAFKVSEQP